MACRANAQLTGSMRLLSTSVDRSNTASFALPPLASRVARLRPPASSGAMFGVVNLQLAVQPGNPVYCMLLPLIGAWPIEPLYVALDPKLLVWCAVALVRRSLNAMLP